MLQSVLLHNKTLNVPVWDLESFSVWLHETVESFENALWFMAKEIKHTNNYLFLFLYLDSFSFWNMAASLPSIHWVEMSCSFKRCLQKMLQEKCAKRTLQQQHCCCLVAPKALQSPFWRWVWCELCKMAHQKDFQRSHATVSWTLLQMTVEIIASRYIVTAILSQIVTLKFIVICMSQWIIITSLIV